MVELTRRSFLHLGGGSLLLAVGGGALAACGSGDGNGRRGKSAALGIGVPTNPLGLDPVKYNDVSNIAAYSLVTEALYRYDSHERPTPLLAADAPNVSGDGLTYRIPIRSGVAFSNGKTLGADDAKFTIDQILKPSNSSYQAPYLAAVSSVATESKDMLLIKLKFPFEYLMDALTSIPLVPSNVAYNSKTYATRLIGTGPYLLESWQQNTQISYRRNPNYWRKGLPHIDKVTEQILPEAATQVADLVNGQLGLLTSITPSLAKVLKSKGQVVYAAPLRESYNMIVNLASGHPTADPNVRHAIAWAIDRGRIANEVFDGYAVPESTNPARGSRFYDEALGSTFGDSPNATKAKSFLTQVGASARNAPVVIVVPTEDPNLVSAMTIVADNLQSIGINAKTQVLEQGAALTKLFDGDYDLWGIAGSVGPPFEAWSVYTPGSMRNLNKVSDPALARLSKKLVSSPAAEGAAITKQIQRRFLQYLPWIPIVTSPYLYARTPTLKGFAVYTPSSLAGVANARFS